MHLYGKPIDDVSWSDVEVFCQQAIVEGATLDYKADFPKELERTIAAMANTFGGVVLIGIVENSESRPILPMAGIAMQRGLPERVLGICVDNIYPPIIPSVQVCPNAGGTRAVVVVRVPQSHEAPHAIASNTSVYVRTGRRNDPDELANLDRVSWLMDRRRKSEEFREWLFHRADARFATLRDGQVPNIDSTTEVGPSGISEQPCLFTVAICPVFPDAEPLVSASELQSIRREIAVQDPMHTTSAGFPIQEGTANRMVEDGVVMHFSGRQGLRTYHTHLNIHGLYFFKQSLLYTPENEAGESGKPPPTFMRASEIIDRTFALLLSAEKFYRRIGYFGPYRVRLRLQRVLGWPLLTFDFHQGQANTSQRHSADPTIDVVKHIGPQDLVDKTNEVVLYLVGRVASAFDWVFTEQMLTRHLQSRNAPLG